MLSTLLFDWSEKRLLTDHVYEDRTVVAADKDATSKAGRRAVVFVGDGLRLRCCHCCGAAALWAHCPVQHSCFECTHIAKYSCWAADLLLGCNNRAVLLYLLG